MLVYIFDWCSSVSVPSSTNFTLWVTYCAVQTEREASRYPEAETLQAEAGAGGGKRTALPHYQRGTRG